MKHDRATALSLLAGAAGGVLTMVLHPTGGSYGLEGERLEHAAAVAAWVHGLGIASIGLQLAGAWGVSARLDRERWCTRAGLVAFLFACIMGSCAATISGLSAPHIAEQLAFADADRGAAMRASLFPLHALVAAFTDVFIVGLALTPLLWAWPLASRARVPALGGLALGVLGLGAYGAGALVDEVHPLGVFVAGFAAWLVALAAWLWRTGD
jgi:hypothetical protein